MGDYSAGVREGTVSEFSISQGVRGVSETLRLMSRLVRDYKKDAFIVTTARMQLYGVPAKNARAEVDALFNFVRRSIRYTQDVADVETIITPDVLLRDIRAGDCDDMSLALATLLETIGYKTRFVACGFEGDDLSHVFVQVKLGRDWIAADATEPYPLGWTPPGASSCIVEHN